MNLEQQVISLELAKRLRELGVKQDSIFYWVRPVNEYHLTGLFNENDRIHFNHAVLDIFAMENYSAFTVAELGEMLRDFELSTRYYEIDHYNTYDFYNLVIKAATCSGRESFYAKDESEANARAKILTFILENKLMEVPE